MTLLGLITRPTLKGVAPTGKFEPHFHGENGSEQEKKFGTVIYASETIQNCKNPTGHLDTLRILYLYLEQRKIQIKLV